MQTTAATFRAGGSARLPLEKVFAYVAFARRNSSMTAMASLLVSLQQTNVYYNERSCATQGYAFSSVIHARRTESSAAVGCGFSIGGMRSSLSFGRTSRE